ncbi:MAG: 7-cyano-7-deazaguanine synthase QueC [Rhodobacteraceae bacterium]|nr:7-cyano-7-deazaguanine synthase QueC [Paracoccaceae bacterium]
MTADATVDATGDATGDATQRCLVLHSGGLDSTVCLLLAKARGREPISLGLRYGQRHDVELDYAARQCARFGIERRIIDVAWDKPEIVIPTDRSMDDMRRAIAPTFLPGRNAVFLALACAEAAGVDASEVWLGVNAVDYSGYPDCRESFLNAFRAMWAEAVPNPPKIVSPLVKMTKPEIAALAASLGLARGDTWSCYAPDLSHGEPRPCGRCDACILHEHAWAEAGRTEPGVIALA